MEKAFGIDLNAPSFDRYRYALSLNLSRETSVVDSELDPNDPYVFGPPGDFDPLLVPVLCTDPDTDPSIIKQK